MSPRTTRIRSTFETREGQGPDPGPNEPAQGENPVMRSPVPRVREGRIGSPASPGGDIQSVLISPDRLRRRIRQLGNEITADLAGKDVVLVAVLTGTVLFLADLVRRLPFQLRLDFLGASSYRGGTRSGELSMDGKLRLEVRGRHVLVVDDILDTGQTLSAVTTLVRKAAPASLRTCVLLDKPAGRKLPVQADYVGFVIPDLFVVGYGLDHDECHRNLPFVGVLNSKAPPPPSKPVRGNRAR